MLRRLHPEQPESFAFTPANQAWAEGQITKYPEGRQASAIIPLLWRAQEQEGWLTRSAIEHVADMLGMAYIRVLEIASFYFMFQLQPVGSIAHFQICGTTTCMICGAEDLIAVCKEKIAAKPHQISEDGKFSWEEVECLGSCTNAPIAQIGKDYYEDLTVERFTQIINELAVGKVPIPGPQNGRYAAEPLKGLTSLIQYNSGKIQYNASVQLAVDIGDTLKRIDGTEIPLLTPWVRETADAVVAEPEPVPIKEASAPVASVPESEASAPEPEAAPEPAVPAETGEEIQPETLAAAREGGPDDLKLLKGIGPKLECTLHELGFFHFDQIAAWTDAEAAWVDTRLKFKGRIQRDGWIEQAKILVAGGKTDRSKQQS
ncbi:MAG: NADH-quinone oxidoreductase subunit E [Rhodobacteraceae bacterium]|nr:NADH-quinone oxidoreductase subunit E [Paracoccaceae bacterium]